MIQTWGINIYLILFNAMKYSQKEQNRLDKERLKTRQEAAKESKLRRQSKAKLARTKITNSLLETSKFEIKNSAGRLVLKDEVITPCHVTLQVVQGL